MCVSSPGYTLTNSYMSESSGTWKPDPSNTSCLTDKLSILKLCQRIYSRRSINNIVESSHNVKIGFCKNTVGSKGGCSKMVYKWVKPYRCLESPFQSDALLVPSPCLFDHIHNSTTCLESKIWNKTALDACKKKGNMNLKSVAVLLPCGVGLFTGVEFVCCPNINKIDETKDNINKNDEYDEYDNEEYDDDDEDDSNEDGMF